jgi:hypothetical protein
MGDALAALKGSDSAENAGDLPLVDVEIFLDGFGREKGSAVAGALGELLQSCLVERARRTETVSVFIGVQYSTDGEFLPHGWQDEVEYHVTDFGRPDGVARPDWCRA